MAQIELRHVVKIFGKDAAGPALSMLRSGASNADIARETGNVVGVADVSVNIEQGEIFVVMGLSGSGKSTLIRCVNRIHEPTAGSVVVDAEDITGYDAARMRQVRREKMSMVFQHFALFPHMSVVDNVAFGLKVQGLDLPDRHEKARNALQQVGLEEWADRYPHNLSGGMQQRVGLARALATDADILLMDEAFSALDPLIRRQMQNEMLELQGELQKTILFITHDLNEALRVGSRVMIMKAGRVVQVGTPTDIVTSPEDDYVADFMADVDHAKVLKATYVMKPAPTISADTEAAYARAVMADHSVCRAASHESCYTEPHEGAFVIDEAESPVGYVFRDQLGDGTVATAMDREFPMAVADTPLAGLFHLSGRGMPVAIVGADRRLRGMVDPIDLMASLGAVEVVDDPIAQREMQEVNT